MADDKKEVFGIDLDTAEFIKKALSAKGAIQDIGSAENMTGLIQGVLAAGTAIAVLGTAALALKTTFDLVFEGEQIRKTNALFDQMAENVGVVGDKLKNDLTKAAGGLADTTDILEAANKSMVALGENAAKLPQIMELARKLTVNFGGDLIERFQQLNYAITSGSERMLKANGIFIDTTKAVNDFARANGVSANALTEAGRRQAILNEVLKYSETRIKELSGANESAINSWQKLKVALNDIKEIVVLLFEKTLGPLVRASINGLAQMADTARNTLTVVFGEGSERAAAGLKILNKHVADLKERIDGINNATSLEGRIFKWLGINPVSTLKALNDEVSKYEEKVREISGLDDEIARKKGYRREEEKAAVVEAIVDQHKAAQERFKLEEEVLRMKQESNRQNIDTANSEEELLAARKEREVLLEQETLLRKEELNERYRSGEIADYESYSQIYDQIEEQHQNKKIENLQTYDNEYKRTLDNQAKHADSFSKGFTASAKQWQQQTVGGLNLMAHVGKATFTALQNRSMQAAEQMGAAFVTHSASASEIMRSMFLNTLGDIAAQSGAVLVAQSVYPPNPLGLAAGFALIALGGAIHAMAGSGGGGSKGYASGGGSGGGGDYSPDTSSSFGVQPDLEKDAVAKRSLTLQVQGDFLNSEESQRRILQIVRDASDTTDFKYVQIGHS